MSFLWNLLAERKSTSWKKAAAFKVLLDGEDVSGEIRTPEVSQMASRASALKPVRQWMLKLQRALGQRGNVVAEGRDIGTVVFPNAEVKIYLMPRYKREHAGVSQELRNAGRQVSLDETLREMTERDTRDSERDLAPLRKAEDAIAIDSSALDAEALAQRVMQDIRKKPLIN